MTCRAPVILPHVRPILEDNMLRSAMAISAALLLLGSGAMAQGGARSESVRR